MCDASTCSIRYMTSSLSKTSVFVRLHVNEKPAFSKILHSWNRFDNIVFNARKGRLPIRVDGRNEEKSLRFQKYLDMCKQGLNQLSKNKEQY